MLQPHHHSSIPDFHVAFTAQQCTWYSSCKHGYVYWPSVWFLQRADDAQVFDGVISVFAPVAAQEFARVLRSPGGILVVAYPGERHLIELKRLLYKQPRLFSEDSVSGADLLSAGFQQAQTIRVRRELTLTQSEAADLLGMTPFFWHAPKDTPKQMTIETGFRTTVDILLAAFRRTQHSG